MNQKFLKENLWLISILFLILVIVFYDVVFLGKTFKITTANPQALLTGPLGQENNRPKFFPVQSTTTSYMEEPIYELLKSCLKKGFLPLWNPYQGCGYPLISMMQLGLFWPLNLIFYFFPERLSWDISIFARFLLAGLFMYWFMRTLRFKRIPSLISGIIFMLSGALVLFQYAFANVEIVAPLVFLSLEYLARNPNRRNSCFVAFTVFLTCLAGHQEHILIVNTLGFLFFCFRIFTLKPRVQRLKALLYLFVGYILAAGLSAFVVFPFVRDWLTEFWHSHPLSMGKQVEGKAFLRETLIGMFSPHFFQIEPVTSRFDRPTFWGYLGIMPLGLVFLSFFSRQKQKLNYFFTFMAFLIFAKSYFDSPLFNWIGDLPIYRNCRFYLHSPIPFALILSILAGMGARLVLSSRRFLKRSLLFSLFVIIMIGWALFYYQKSDHFKLSIEASKISVGVLILFQLILLLKYKRNFAKRYLGWILVSAIVFELFLYVPRGRVNRFSSFPKVPYIEYLRNQPERSRAYGTFFTLYPNTATGYEIDDLGITQGLFLRRFTNYVNQFIFKDYFSKNWGRSSFNVVPLTFLAQTRPYFDLLNVKFTVAPLRLKQLYKPANKPDFPTYVYSDEVYLFQFPDAFSRAFIVHKAIFEPKEDRAIEVMKEIKGEFRRTIVIEHMPIPEILKQLSSTPSTDDSAAKITEYSPNQVTVEADLKNPGFLVLSDSYHPDWKAYVDGKPSEIYITDYMIRSVFLSAGKHVVKFRFEPFAFYWGIMVSLISLGGVIILFIRHKNSI